MRKKIYKGLHNLLTPNHICYYDEILGSVEYFDHVIEEDVCYDYKCYKLYENGVEPEDDIEVEFIPDFDLEDIEEYS